MRDSDKIYRTVKRVIKFLKTGDEELSPGQRAALAKLRRGVGKEPREAPETWGIVFRRMPDDFLVQAASERAVYTALTFYALHQQSRDKNMHEQDTSFGSAVAKLCDGDNDSAINAAINRRFDAVATSDDFAELAHHARSLIQLLRAKEIPFDYCRFAKELYELQHPDSRDRRLFAWGRDFHQVYSAKTWKNAKNAKNAKAVTEDVSDDEADEIDKTDGINKIDGTENKGVRQ